MSLTLLPYQQIQLQSFWNLIQATDESVQKQLYILLQQKYTDFAPTEKPLSFLDLQGVLRGSGNVSVDHEKLTEYLKDKYEI